MDTYATPSVHCIELAHKDTKEDSLSLHFHNYFILPAGQEWKTKKEGREGGKVGGTPDYCHHLL